MLNTKMMKMMQLCGTVAVILATVEAMDAETENKPETTETPSSSSPGQEADMMNPLAETIEYTCAHSDDPRVVKLGICCGTSTNGRNYVWWNNSWTCVCCASTRFCVNYEKCSQGRTNRGFTCTTGGFANDQDVDGWIRKGNSDKWKCKECVKIKTCVRCSKDSKNIGEFCDRKYPESYPIGWRYETSDGEKRWHCNECLKKSYICVNTGEDSASSKCAGISEEKDAYFLMKEDKGWKCTECARIKYSCVECNKDQWIFQTNNKNICDGKRYIPDTIALGWKKSDNKSGKERWHCNDCLALDKPHNPDNSDTYTCVNSNKSAYSFVCRKTSTNHRNYVSRNQKWTCTSCLGAKNFKCKFTWGRGSDRSKCDYVSDFVPGDIGKLKGWKKLRWDPKTEEVFDWKCTKCCKMDLCADCSGDGCTTCEGRGAPRSAAYWQARDKTEYFSQFQ